MKFDKTVVMVKIYKDVRKASHLYLDNLERINGLNITLISFMSSAIMEKIERDQKKFLEAHKEVIKE